MNDFTFKHTHIQTHAHVRVVGIFALPYIPIEMLADSLWASPCFKLNFEAFSKYIVNYRQSIHAISDRFIDRTSSSPTVKDFDENCDPFIAVNKVEQNETNPLYCSLIFSCKFSFCFLCLCSLWWAQLHFQSVPLFSHTINFPRQMLALFVHTSLFSLHRKTSAPRGSLITL